MPGMAIRDSSSMSRGCSGTSIRVTLAVGLVSFLSLFLFFHPHMKHQHLTPPPLPFYSPTRYETISAFVSPIPTPPPTFLVLLLVARQYYVLS